MRTKKLQIKVSQPFARYINETAKELGFRVEAAVEQFTRQQYLLSAGEPEDAEAYGDYVPANGLYKAIVLAYPQNFYAAPRHLTTKRLLDEFRRRRVGNEQELKRMLRDLCEI